MADKVLFYPVWVTVTGGDRSGRRTALRWSRPCDAPSEARQIGEAEINAGRATLAFVVRFGDSRPNRS